MIYEGIISEPRGDALKMHISEAAAGFPALGVEPCRFPKLEECAHFHYERVHLPKLDILLQTTIDPSLHSQHSTIEEKSGWYTIQVTSGDETWLVQRDLENFRMLDAQLHQCIFDRKVSMLPDLSVYTLESIETLLIKFLSRFSKIADNSINCGPVLNWLQMDNKGHRLLVPSEESRSINTPAVAAAYSVRKYVSQARDELNLEVGDMISVIDMANPGESMWWRGKRGFQVGFFPQHCVHIIGDKVPRNIPLPPPVVGSLALTSIKPVLRKHGKLITFFRSFILNRPSRRRLKQSGILKERVFGCDLGEHLLNSGHDIPMVLKCCAEFIEKNGIVDGIYRLSGITSNIQKLRNAFDEDRVPNLYTDEILQDIHSVASLLKMYFRDLPNPLCTYQLYQSFVNAVQGSANRSPESDHRKLIKMREAVLKLPPPHYRTLEYLTRHLARVAKHGHTTGMTTRNVAIVWAPNLLRSAELEIGGVAALQRVGVQAVVTEFLICFADLIFCDQLPTLNKPLSPKRLRPKSLAISTPTKLITLEEAQSKHMTNKSDEYNYIEVGGGPTNLPKKYHTIIELPSGTRKRAMPKRSPLGWKSFFSKSRASQENLTKNRKTSILAISVSEQSVVETGLNDSKKLRSVKSAESLTSGYSEPTTNNELDTLGPLHTVHKHPGHNRSVSHDSYFDTLQNSLNNSEGSLLDLSEIQLNFDLEDTEMKIFSEDESLVSSPKVNKNSTNRPVFMRPKHDPQSGNSGNPSPKKQPRVTLSPDSMSRKRTRLEDQLCDIQYIDCPTPENVVSTTVMIHSYPVNNEPDVEPLRDSVECGTKAFKNLSNLERRQSLILEENNKLRITKSLTETDIVTPLSPMYQHLGESSSNTTPGMSSDYTNSPTGITYQNLDKDDMQSAYSSVFNVINKNKPSSLNENILTTISITYKSPPRSLSESPLKKSENSDNVYENVILLTPEKALIPTSVASLPVQEASQPELQEKFDLQRPYSRKEKRPKSLNALDDGRNSKLILPNLGSNNNCDKIVFPFFSSNGFNNKTLFNSDSNICYSQSFNSISDSYNLINRSSITDLSLSEVLPSSTENLNTSQTSLSSAYSPTGISQNVSTTNLCLSSDTLGTKISSEGSFLRASSEDLYKDFKPTDDHLLSLSSSKEDILENFEDQDSSKIEFDEKRSSLEDLNRDKSNTYQQVKYFWNSVHQVNTLPDSKKEKVDNDPDSEPNAHLDLNVSNSNVYICNEENKNVIENSEIHDSSLSIPVIQNYESPRETKDSSIYKNVLTLEHTLPKISEDKISVKDLLVKFEDNKDFQNYKTSVAKTDIPPNNTTNCTVKFKKVYDKGSLPPCLRARNLKNQLRTRSLDEEEFKNELECKPCRKKVVDENVSYKTNSLPKKLNLPKVLPVSDDNLMQSLHLSHSSENITKLLDEEQRKRERIEKYKEERRKYLSQKYRSESFKETKDVLLSRCQYK